jgi:hypothetical protein
MSSEQESLVAEWHALGVFGHSSLTQFENVGTNAANTVTLIPRFPGSADRLPRDDTEPGLKLLFP